jgi:aspartyl-tRNA(Asn)/glutamyl-tRNA(Gln) amidotransferase subunit A
MTDAELKKLTLADALKLLSQRRVSSEELHAATLARIERLNPAVRAFITVITHDRTALPRLTVARGTFVLKDLYDTAGIPTTAGSKVFAQRVPQETATCVTKLEGCGSEDCWKNQHA